MYQNYKKQECLVKENQETKMILQVENKQTLYTIVREVGFVTFKSKCGNSAYDCLAFQGILDIFREGFVRLFTGGGPRALPMWYLIPATVSYGLIHYIISSSVSKQM